ncbi:hypothetical protein ABIE78_002103 [Sinorhizobium fredii]
MVARDKGIAGKGGSLAFFAGSDGEWLQIGVVGKEDAGVLRAEGMTCVIGNGEAEIGEALPCPPEFRNRQHEMIERAGGARGQAHGGFPDDRFAAVCNF